MPASLTASLPAFPGLLAQLAPESAALGIGLAFMLLIGLGICTGLALFGLWIWMLVDCAQAPDEPGNANSRVIWILILVFTGWLGALLYFFIVRQPRRARLLARPFPAHGAHPSFPPR